MARDIWRAKQPAKAPLSLSRCYWRDLNTYTRQREKSMGTRQVRIDTKRKKWRYRCPNGHASWSTTNNHMWCQACSRQHGVDPEFWELHDTKTGERVPREQIQLYD